MLRNYPLPNMADGSGSAGQSEKRLQDLRKYIPFLHRMIGRLSSSEDSSRSSLRDNINSLLEIITSGKHLKPETLDRCEQVLRKICDKVERDEQYSLQDKSGGLRRQDHHHSVDPRESQRQNATATDVDDTPRSPSPEETVRLTTLSAPRSIPVSDTRSPLSERSILHQERFHESRSKQLRNEPVEIPQTRHVNESPYQRNVDRDYRRHVYSPTHTERRSPVTDHRSFSSGHRHHNSDRYPHEDNDLETRAMHSRQQSGHPDLPGNRYRGTIDSDRNMPSPNQHSHPFDNRHPRVPPLMSSGYPTRESDVDMRAQYQDRHSNASPSPYPAPTDRIVKYRDDHWDRVDPQEAQRNDFRQHERNEAREIPRNDFWKPGSGPDHWEPHQPDSREVSRSYPWETARHEPWERNDPGYRGWDDPRNVRPCPPFQPHPQQPSFYDQRRPPLLPAPHPEAYNSSPRPFLLQNPRGPGPVRPMGSSYHPPGNFGSYGPPQAASSKGPRALLPSPPVVAASPAARREDPRLARRQAAAATAASSTSVPNTQNKAATPSFATEAAPQRVTSELPAERPKPTVASEEFCSPLGSLYNAPKSCQTGRGYGTQNYKIVKKKPAEPEKKPEAFQTELEKNGVNVQNPPTEQASADKVPEETNVPECPESPGEKLVISEAPVPEEQEDSAKQESVPETVVDKPAEEQSSSPAAEPDRAEVPQDETPDPESADTRPVAVPEVPDKPAVLEQQTPNAESVSQPEPSIPLDVIEQFLRKALPVEDAEKVLQRVRQAEMEKLASKDTTSAGETVPVVKSEEPSTVEEPKIKQEVPEEPQESVAGPSAEAIPEKPPVKRRKANTMSMYEVQRLQNDLVDFLRNAEDLDGRRTRRGRIENKPDTSVSDTPAQLPAKVPSKRGRKRKQVAVDDTAPANDTTTAKDDTPDTANQSSTAQDTTVNTDVDMTDVAAAVETEPTTATPSETPVLARKKPGRKRKGPAKKGVARNPAEILEDGAEVKSEPKTAKKRKTFLPTHLSLRGRKSMYEASEMLQVEMPDLSEVPSAGQQFFQCKECSYLGEKIVHHYVNEHKGVEIPYVTVAQTQWEVIKDQPLGPPEDYKLKNEVLNDFEWIPSRQSFMNQVSCKMCSFAASTRAELLEHFVSHAFEPGSRFRCALCDATEESFYEIYDHIAVHTGEFRYHCGYCEYRVARRSGMKHHMTSLHDAQDRLFYRTDTVSSAQDMWIFGYVCVECHYIQMHEDNIIRHIESHESCHSYCKINVFEYFVEEHENSEQNLEQSDSEPKQPAEMLKDKDINQLVSSLKTRLPTLAGKLSEKLKSSTEGKPEDLLDNHEAKCCAPRKLEYLNPVPSFEFEFPALDVDQVPATDKSLLTSTISKLLGRLGDSGQEATLEDLVEENLSSQDEGEDGSEEEEKVEPEVEEEEEVNPPEVDSNAGIPEPNADGFPAAEAEQEKPVIMVPDDDVGPLFIEESDSFLKISSVVSLNPLPEVSKCSRVILMRRECQFPYKLPHDRLGLIATLKKPDAFSSMLVEEKICHLFKCVAYCCSFSSDCPSDFLAHLRVHCRDYDSGSVDVHDLSRTSPGGKLVVPDFFLCPYCPAVGAAADDVIEHVTQQHSACLYQCSGCFHRALTLDYAEFHAKKAHPDHPETRIIRLENAGEVTNPIPEQIPIRKLSSVGPYNCAYCCHGDSSLLSITEHLVMRHPQFRGKYYVRGEVLIELDVPEVQKTMEMVILDQAALGRNSLDDDSEEEEDNDDLTIRITDVDADFYGFGDDELVRAKENTKCVMEDIESEMDEASTDTAVSPAVPKSGEIFIEDGGGLCGNDLFKCGFVGCSFSAPTAATLREHLFVCDVSRDSKTLRCYHCSKTLKHTANLIEHLRVHGTKPYSCALCGKQGQIAAHIRKHMKASHRVLFTDVVDMETDNKDPDRQHFIVYPKEMNPTVPGLGNGRSSAAKTSFTWQEIADIPACSISAKFLRCRHCPYRTKVRVNLISHLRLHEKNEEQEFVVPAEPPVNPVPCLERKEKYFDKMTNLASSSHANGRMGGKMGGANNAAAPEQASCVQFPSLPVFVADNQRYVCGYAGCTYLTVTETMLKNHLTTLHKDANFACPHCPLSDVRYNEGHFRNHLKLHGPRLYKCGHCMFFHWQHNMMERHLAEKHPNRPPWEHVIREPAETESSRAAEGSRAAAAHPWRCSLCKYTSLTSSEMLFHVKSIHNLKSQYKCALCPVRYAARADFEQHFATCHPKQKVNILTMYHRKDDPEEAGKYSDGDYLEDCLPIWSRDRVRVRHIRGILLEEEEMKEEPVPVEEDLNGESDLGDLGAPSNGMLCCPKCNSYRTVYQRDMRDHLFRELNYKKYLCSECSFQCVARCTLRKHYKTHKDVPAVMKVSTNATLEQWVEKVIKHQSALLKKSTEKPSPAKGRKLPATPSKSAVPSNLLKATTTPQKAGDPLVVTVKTEVAETPSAAKTVYSCTHCSYTTESESFFKRHEAFHETPDESYPCLSCSFTASMPSALENHVIASHSDVQSHVCLECGFQTADRKNLMAHFRATKHKKSNRSEPRIPETSILIKEEREPEQSTAQPISSLFQCNQCEFRGSNRFKLKEHVESKHSGKPVFVVAKSPVYVCSFCQMNFLSENEIIQHHVAHPRSVPLRYTRILPKNSKSSAKNVITEIRFECPVCNRRFTSLRGAQNHISDHNQSWKCGHCSQLFGSPTLAMRHFKEKHPGIQGTVQSCTAGHFVMEKLKQGISLHRAQYQVAAKDCPKSPRNGVEGNESSEELAVLEVSLETEPAESPAVNEPTANTVEILAEAPVAGSCLKPVNGNASSVDEFSFYGTVPEDVDYSNVMTEMAFGETAPVKLTVATLARVIPLFPKIFLEDCAQQK